MTPRYFASKAACVALAALLIAAPAHSATFADARLAACVANAMEQSKVASPKELVSLTCNGKGIEDAKGMGALSGLQTLSLFGNRLTQIDVGALVNLRTLNLANNRLTQIDLASIPGLTTLYLFGNVLRTLNLEANPALKKVKAEKNQILTVVFPKSSTLQKVYMFDNKMEDIKIDSLPALKFLDVRSNPMPDEVYDYLDGFSGLKASHDGNTEEWR